MTLFPRCSFSVRKMQGHRVFVQTADDQKQKDDKQRGCQEKPAEVIGIARDGCWHENHGHIQDQGDNQQQYGNGHHDHKQDIHVMTG